MDDFGEVCLGDSEISHSGTPEEIVTSVINSFWTSEFASYAESLDEAVELIEQLKYVDFNHEKGFSLFEIPINLSETYENLSPT